MLIMRLVRTDFDSLENQSSAAITSKTILIAMNDSLDDDSEVKTAYVKVRDYLRLQAPSPLYLGWNNEVYPQWTVSEETVI